MIKSKRLAHRKNCHWIGLRLRCSRLLIAINYINYSIVYYKLVTSTIMREVNTDSISSLYLII